MKVIGSAFVVFVPNKFLKCIKDINIFKKEIGGSGANIAIAEARLEAKTSLITKVGEDIFGDFIIEKLKKEGVDVKYINPLSKESPPFMA
jgi:fructokinase